MRLKYIAKYWGRPCDPVPDRRSHRNGPANGASSGTHPPNRPAKKETALVCPAKKKPGRRSTKLGTCPRPLTRPQNSTENRAACLTVRFLTAIVNGHKQKTSSCSYPGTVKGCEATLRFLKGLMPLLYLTLGFAVIRCPGASASNAFVLQPLSQIPRERSWIRCRLSRRLACERHVLDHS